MIGMSRMTMTALVAGVAMSTAACGEDDPPLEAGDRAEAERGLRCHERGDPAAVPPGLRAAPAGSRERPVPDRVRAELDQPTSAAADALRDAADQATELDPPGRRGRDRVVRGGRSPAGRAARGARCAGRPHSARARGRRGAADGGAAAATGGRNRDPTPRARRPAATRLRGSVPQRAGARGCSPRPWPRQPLRSAPCRAAAEAGSARSEAVLASRKKASMAPLPGVIR